MMDGARFDDWTKRIAAPTTGRHLLGLVSGITIAAVGFPRTTDAGPTSTATPADVVPVGPYPTPLSNPFGTCPATGEGGDRELNVLKNRTDAVADSKAFFPT
jgi:hypothetical protein